MIVRDDGEGLLIIRQGDHAALAAEIAKAWHPPGTPQQRPPTSLLAAAEHHDDGWRTWEDGSAKALDAKGRPRDFLNMPLDDHLAIWQASIDQTTQYDLYAGILVSMHAVALYEGRLSTQADSEPVRARITAFNQEQRDWQAQMLDLLAGRAFYDPHLSDAALAANLKLLQVWDTLSLMLCVPWGGTHTFEGVRLPDGGLHALTATGDAAGALALSPYPLHQEPFPLSIAARRLARQSFARPADLGRAYLDAPGVELWFVLHAA